MNVERWTSRESRYARNTESGCKMKQTLQIWRVQLKSHACHKRAHFLTTAHDLDCGDLEKNGTVTPTSLFFVPGGVKRGSAAGRVPRVKPCIKDYQRARANQARITRSKDVQFNSVESP